MRDHNNPLCDKFPFLSIAQHFVTASFGCPVPEFYIFIALDCSPNASAPLLQDKELSGKEQPDNRRLLSMRDVSRNMHLLVINWKVHENSTTPWPWRDLVVVNEMTWGAPIPAFGNKHSRFESSYSPTLRVSPDGH